MVAMVHMAPGGSLKALGPWQVLDIKSFNFFGDSWHFEYYRQFCEIVLLFLQPNHFPSIDRWNYECVSS